MKQKDNAFYIVIIILLGMILALRAPRVFLEGRIWAEEGNIFFKTAWESGLSSLIHLYAGYLNLFANICAYVMTLLPLKFAAYIPVYASFFVELGVIAYVLFQNNEYLNAWSRFFLACMLVMSPNSTSELYCNSINMQSWFGILGIVLLFENGNLHRKKIQYISFIAYFIGCLSGVYCLFTVPFMIMRMFFYLKSRTNKQIINYWKILSIIGVFAGCTQALSVAYSFLSGSLGLRRGFKGFNIFESVTYAFRFHFVLPLLGPQVTRQIGAVGNIIVGVVFLAIILLLLWLLDKRVIKYAVYIWGFLVFAQILIIGSCLNHMAGGRYAFIPSFLTYMLLALLLTAVMRKRNSMIFVGGAIYLIYLTTVCFDEYATNTKGLYYPRILSWDKQVEAYEKNANYEFQAWPDTWPKFILDGET